jgi:LysM repeat protein
MSSIFDGIGNEGVEQLDENLHKWFKEKWVRFGPDGKIRGACARGDDSEGKPKCLPQKKAQNLGKKGRKYAASKKRREDPNPERTGKAKNVATKKKTNEGVPFNECPKCRGPIVHESMMNEKQDACYHKVKSRYKVWPSAYASGALVQCRKKGASNWGNSKKNENSVMKGIVDESTNFVPKNILTEGKVLLEGRVVRKLWESAGQKIIEAQLTPQQIQQIFQAAEQGQTTAGGNRTFAGKGVDAASAVNRAWEDLKTKIQNTGPIQNMDAMYDKAAETMKKSTGGDQGAMQYVQKYRDFAKKHPIAQSFLYAALIAAAGLSGAGLGGAAALGLLKMTDRLLQGDKFSSALYKGGVTGALAYGAAKIGDLLRQPAAPGQPVEVKLPDGKDIVVKPGDTLSEIAQKNNVSVQDLLNANKDILNPDAISAGQNINVPNATGNPTYQGGVGTASDTLAKMQSGQYAQSPISYRQAAKAGLQGAGDQVTSVPGAKSVAKATADQAVNAPSAATDAPASAGNQAPDVKPAADTTFSTATDNIAQNDTFNSVAKEIKGKVVDMDPNGAWAKLANGKIVDPDFPRDVSANNDAIAAYKLLNKTNEGVQLSKYQVFNIMEAAIMYQTALNEGLLDKFKGAASKVGQYAATKGKNITTKITADKLIQAWKKAGSPTDSEQVKAVLKAAGVADQVIASVMPVQASIAGASPNATTGTIQSTMKATTQPTVAAKPQAPAAPAAPAQAAQPASAIGQGIAKSPQANVNPELYNRLAARKAGKPVYAGGLEEAKAKPYVKPFIENGKQVGWKSSDGYHVKYWQMFAKDSAIKHAKISPDEVQEDYTGEFAAEQTPAINPYGGLKDNQFRGAISETPTDNPTGASGEGGWRKFKAKSAGTFKEDLSQADVDGIARFADKLYKKLGIDITFTKHFMDRVNDERNGKPISGAELVRLFKREYERWGKDVAQMGPDMEGTFKDLSTDINLPFVLRWDRDEEELDLVAKTVMRKKNFKTDNQEFPVDEDTAYAGGMGQGGNAGESYRKFKPKSAGTFKEDELDEACWKGYHKEGNKKMFGKTYPNCVKNTNEEEQIDESFMQVSRINRVLKKNGFELYNDNMPGDHDNSVIQAEWHHPSGRKISTFTPNVGGGLLGNTYPSKYISVKLHGNGGIDEYKESTAEFLPTSPRDLNRYLSSSNSSKVELDEKCWDTHKQVGMKNKGGRQVPNCVPKESAIMKGLKSL